LGSVEFAAATFQSPLVVVMGHTGCGAVAATVSAILEGKPAPSPNINDIVERIAPGIRELVRPGANPSNVIPTAIRANVRASVNHLRHGSRLLEDRLAAGHLVVIGAEYALETGAVNFFDMESSRTAQPREISEAR
jgi:carbonic anhydrase